MKKLSTALTAILLLFSTVVYSAPVTEIVVPFSAGGLLSVMSRLIEVELDRSGVDTIVVNKPGGEGIIAGNYVLSKPADGTTMLNTGPTTFIYNKVIGTKVDFDYKDFEFFGPIAHTPLAISVNGKSKIKTFQEFVDYGRNNRVNCGAAGGALALVATHLIDQLKFKDVQIVLFKSTVDLETQLSAGNIDCSIDTLAVAKGFARNKFTKIIALSSDTKSNEFQDASLLSEVIPGFTYYAWFAIAIRKDTPTAKKTALFNRLNAIVKTEKYKLGVVDIGYDIAKPKKNTRAWLDSEYQKLEEIYQSTNKQVIR